jgi:hypothetical protein
MRTQLTLAPLLFLALAACDGERSVSISTTSDDKPKGVLRVVDALQCPEVQGQLTRKGTAAEGGTVCRYVGPRGAEVELRLVKLDGRDVGTALGVFETDLRKTLPRAAAADAATAVADASGDQASVSAPGIRIEAEGDRADVRIGSFRIQANDGDAAVKAGEPGAESVSVQAGTDGAEVRVRVQGEATRATWLLTDTRDEAVTGWRLVGYEARGPVGGPLVVALVHSKDENRDEAFDDAVDLVSLNVGD